MDQQERTKPLSRTDVLEEAKKTVTSERVDQYGAPENSFWTIANYWNNYLKDHVEIKNGIARFKPLDNTDAAIMLTLFKIARQQSGEGKMDNFVDGCGYMSIAGELFSHNNNHKL